MKKGLLIVVIVILAIAAGFLYFSREEIIFPKDTTLYKAVPVTSPFFLEFNSLKAVPFGNPAIDELEEAEIWTRFFQLTQNLDTLIQNNNNFPANLRNTSFVLSFPFAGRNDLVPLIITGAEGNNRKKALENLIHHLYPSGKFSYSEKKYGKHTITEIGGAINNEPLFYSFAGDVFLIGTKSISVEQSIRQLVTDGILKNQYFRAVNKSAGSQADVALYINHQYFTDYAGQLLNGRTKTEVDEFGETQRKNIRRQLEAFKSFAEWTEFDFQFNDDHILLNGTAAADDSLGHFLSVFNGQQTVRFQAENALPQNTSFFCSYAFSDKDEFFKRLDNYFSHTDFYYTREERMKRFDRGTRSIFKNELQGMVKNEIIVATTTIPVDPENKTVYFIFQTEDQPAAEEQLNKLLTNYTVRNNIEPSEMKMEYSVNEEISYPVYRFPYPSFPGIWLGSPFGIAKANYVAFYGDFMVFSNTERGLREYLRSMELGAGLTNNTSFQRFKQKNSNRANINVYADLNRAFGFGNELLSGKMVEILEEKSESLRKFGFVSWQIKQDKELFASSVVVDYNPNARDQAQTVWQSTIGHNVRLKPRLVTNHNDVANREIVFQDEQNNLFQLTGEGRIRWSIPLSEPVLGEIHQVDYYENGKLQYLFNTKEKLYLVDREGNNVAHFPVEFKSPATNGVNVFDYHNNRDYRYFIAHENRKVVAYDKTAGVLSGWVFETTESRVSTPVQHFRIDNRDYIVFKDETKVYIQNRRGETRVETSAWFENSKNPLYLDLNGTPKIVTTDVAGQVHYIYFSGEHEEKKTDSFGKEHFFIVDDLDGNTVPDFVFVDGNQLVVLDENGKKQFSEKFDNPLNHPPNIYTFGPELKKVGVVEAAANRIHLFNPDGKQHQGFPLQGNTEFSIGKLSDNHTGLSLIVGSEGGKLYNYSLN